MPRGHVRNGLYTTSDILMAAALMSRNSVIRDGIADYARDVLPALELEYVFIETVERRYRKQKRRRHTPGVLEYTGPGGIPDSVRTVRVPVITFAFKPYRGNHRLADMKCDLWHGDLWGGAMLHTHKSIYGPSVAILRFKSQQAVDRWRRKFHRPTDGLRFRACRQEIHELQPKGASQRIELTTSDLEEVPNGVVEVDATDDN